MAGLKKKWDKFTQGAFGTFIYMVLGFFIAVVVMYGLGIAFNTTTPVVSVVSCSMEHTANPLCEISMRPATANNICGQYVEDYDNSFDSFWQACGQWYMDKGITKEEFRQWDFSDGLSVGDILIVVYNKGEIQKGDIIVFDHPTWNYPVIHRVYEINGDNVITKGDRNPTGDGPTPLNKIYGKGVIKMPLLGWVKIIFTKVTGIA